MKQVTNLFQAFFLTCCLLLACGPMAQASVKYVKQTASGTGDGSSWANASDDLQAMIDAAVSGDEVWVAAGTYKPTNCSPCSGTDRSIFFAMKEGVAILGGFPATGNPGIFNRNWTANVTTLSGDIGILGDNSDNSYNVIRNTNNGLTTSAILDGFTVSDGNADSPSYNNGGGMFNFSTSPKVVNCLFENNASDSFGGGMHNIISSPDVINCTFSGNSAGSSGGGMNNISSSPTLTNCLFINNSAEISGGGMNQSGSSILTSCSFIGNYSGNTGGGMFISGSPTLTNCVFRGNSVASTGGGIFNSGSPTLTNCSFSGNEASASGLGGVAGSSLLMTNCILWGNSSGITGSASVTYSIVQGGHPGAGNLNVDPLFVSATDLSLQAGSPAIDGGDDNANNTPLDLAGNNRKIDAIPGGALIDMGAYEFQSPICQLNPVCANPTVQLDATGNVTVYAMNLNGGSTGCGTLDFSIGISGLPSTTFDCSGIGTNLVTLTVTDDNGSATCSATVNIVDLTDPVALCQTAAVQLDGNGNASLTPAAVDGGSSDNCGITMMSVFPSTFTCANVGANNVTLTVEDAFGNKHSCMALVDVQDTTNPIVICPADITADVDAGICCATLTIDAPTASDNCTTLNFSNDRNGTNDASGIYFPGETILNWTATDGLGNIFTCVQSVTVEDNEAPMLGYTDEVCYAEYKVCLEEQAAYTAEQLAELEIFIANCNGDPACLQEAERVALGIDEASRKYMAICLFILNGCDVIPAANNQLPDIVVEAPVGSCEIELNPGPVVMENCATFTLTNDFTNNGTGEGIYPVGTTVVTWTAVDQYGNTSTVSRSITVIGVGDADCDGVTDGCDICPDGDDSVDANEDGIPDCSQLLSYKDYSEDWKCGNNKIYISHNGQTNCINKNALPAHFNHGDAIGPYQSCPQSLVAPNGGGNHEHGHAEHRELTLFPNPASHEINIQFSRHSPQATLQITDMLGRVVFTKELAEGVDRTEIDLGSGNFKNGMYQVSLFDGGETTTKQLVIIQ